MFSSPTFTFWKKSKTLHYHLYNLHCESKHFCFDTYSMLSDSYLTYGSIDEFIYPYPSWVPGRSSITVAFPSFFFFFLYFQFYNIVLVSATHQGKPAIIIHRCPGSRISLPSPIPPLLAITEHRTGHPGLHSHQLRACICWCYFAHPSHSLPLPRRPQ